MRETFLTFGAPAIEQPEIDAVAEVMRSGWIGTGLKAAQFEADFRAYKGWGYPVALNSCTAALHLSLLGLEPGSEVITSALTFCATVNAIIHAGLKPVLADIDPETMNIDPEDVEQRITPRTRALIPVHFAGRPCEMDAICQISKGHGLRLIEDCAHAVEATYHGESVGTFGDFGCFSFYATKNVTTGEGGMLLARTEQDAGRCRALSLHGMTRDAWARYGWKGYKHYDLAGCGFKYNMPDILAAIGIEQLKRVERNWKRRTALYNSYRQALQCLPIVLPALVPFDQQHAFHLFPILVKNRDEFLNEMTRRNIGVGVHYRSMAEHSPHRDIFGWHPDDYPHARDTGRHTVSLPLSASLTDEDQNDVISAIKEIL